MANQTLTPEQAALFAQLSGVQGQQDLADNELAKAAALRRQAPVHAAGKWGGIAAGLANALNGIDSAISNRMGMDQKRAAYGQNTAANQALLAQYGQLGMPEDTGPDVKPAQTMIAPTGTK